MPLSRLSCVLAMAFCSLVAGLAKAQDNPEPGTRWVCVYGWVQIGQNLSTAEQWALALGSFIEAEQQLKALKDDAPDFEPEMVDYRLEWLGNEIDSVKEKIDADDHYVMTKYLDFIESFEQGQSERFRNQYDKALETLSVAKLLLDEIIAVRPSNFRTAINTQYDMLLDSIIWLESQVNYEASLKKVPVIVDTTDWGTTQFVKEDDLPTEAGVVAASGLFPPALIEMAAASERPGSQSVEVPPVDLGGEGSSLPRFRMSSQE